MRHFFILAIVTNLILSCTQSAKKLPILGRKEIKNVEFDGKIKADTIYHTIPDFSFINQDGEIVTQDTFKDKILFDRMHGSGNCPWAVWND